MSTRIVSQSVPVSYSHFPAPQLLLCALCIAGLIEARSVCPPPVERESSLSRVAAYLEVASVRLQARYASIDAEIEAMRRAYNTRSRTITIKVAR